QYKVEPYVCAADVYSSSQHKGRGGWTWYTGSASWMFRAAVEGILGVNKTGEYLEISPNVPATWKEFGLDYRHGKDEYSITVRNPEGVTRGVGRVMVDGVQISGTRIPLRKRQEQEGEAKKFEVIVEMGNKSGK